MGYDGIPLPRPHSFRSDSSTATPETFMSESISVADLRIDLGENGYLLWNDPNGYYWCGGTGG